VYTRLSEHAGQHELEMKMGGVRVRHRRWEQGGKTVDIVKFAGSAGETRGVPRFDFRDLVLAEETLSGWCNKNCSGRPDDESASCGKYRDLEFTAHHFPGPDVWVSHPSPSDD